MKKVRIMIVDDSARFTSAAAEYLSALDGVDVLACASSGEAATQRAEVERPDLVLTDLMMPGMNGLEVTRIMKRMRPAPKVVVVSMMDALSYAEEARLAGADEFLSKARLSVELVPLIERLFGAELAHDSAGGRA